MGTAAAVDVEHAAVVDVGDAERDFEFLTVRCGDLSPIDLSTLRTSGGSHQHEEGLQKSCLEELWTQKTRT